MSLELLNATTYEALMPSGDRVEIGDKDSKDFEPHLKLNRWDGECFIKVGLPVTEKSLPIIEGNKIIWEGWNRHILMYPKAPTKQFELGAYEYEVVLEKKPKSNKIILDLQSQGLKFFYQPALTQQEIEEGCFRPDNIIGSYAVYHATKRDHILGKTNYMCGKAFHVFRPKIIDAKGDWAWEEQYIDPITGKQIITIPLEFLEYAHYPIRHVAGDTFGYTSTSASVRNTGTNEGRGSLFTSPADVDTAQSISAYGYGHPDGNAETKGILVLHSNLNIITNGIGGAVGWPYSWNWYTSTFSTPPTLVASTLYILMIVAGNNLAYFGYDTGGADQGHYDNSNNFTSPQDLGSVAHSTDKHCIYCTYTPAGAPEVVDGTAAGSGIGLGTSTALLDVLASASASGIGSFTASSLLIIPASASASGIGSGTATALLNIFASAQGSGIGLGEADAYLVISALASGEGTGEATAQALLDVLAQASGSGIGLASATGLIPKAIAITLSLYDRTLTAALFDRILVVPLFDRTITSKLLDRDAVIKLFERAISLIKRTR